MNWPIDFTKNIKNNFGAQGDEILKALSLKQFSSLRLHPQKPIKNAFGHNNIKWEKDGIQLNQEYSFVFDPLWHAGAYYVQESSSMFLGAVFNQLYTNTFPRKALDLCAAPGGKTTHLLSKMDDNGFLVSNEILPKRNAILRENIQKWGYKNIIVTQNKPIDFQNTPNFFDLILVDAPCSGEGLFRKKPRAAQEWSTENVLACATRQKQILTEILPSLQNGGYLIYSTCTFEPSENEDIIDFAINELNLNSIELDISEFENISKTSSKKGVGYYFFPHKVEGSGLFMAILQKSGLPFDPKPKENPKSEFTFTDWLKTDDSINIIKKNDRFFLFPNEHLDAISHLSNSLYITYLGIEIGQLKGKDFIPSHQLALSNCLKENFNCIEVNKDNALKYLKKIPFEPIQMPLNLGWAVVKFENTNLGWAKIIQGRINNYLPLNWRILKDLETT